MLVRRSSIRRPLPPAALPGLLVLLVLGTGCATYRQVRVDELPPQQRVRLQLTPEEVGRNIAFASGNQGLISGRFVDARGDSATFVLTSPTGYSQVSLPLESILLLERKDPNHGRSIFLSAALVGGVATLAYLGFEGDENSGPNPDEDDVDALRPVIRFVVPLGW